MPLPNGDNVNAQNIGKKRKIGIPYEGGLVSQHSPLGWTGKPPGLERDFHRLTVHLSHAVCPEVKLCTFQRTAI